MRVAFVGSHRTGKTTLVEAVAAALPGYDAIEEPYRLLEDDGYEFADPPTAEDYQAQLARAVASLEEAGRDALFDRCPLDLVAYLRAIGEDPEEVDLSSLDLVVRVPIEEPDRIVVAAHEDRRLRRRVDEIVEALVRDVDVPVVEVAGPLAERVRQVLAAITAG